MTSSPAAKASPPGQAAAVAEKPRAKIREHGLGALGQRAFVPPTRLVLLSKLAQTAPETLARATPSAPRSPATGDRLLPVANGGRARLGSDMLAAVEAELRAILDLVAEPPAVLPAEHGAD